MSVARVTAIGVYATVFTWTVWANGFPLERTIVVAWLLGLALLVLGGREAGVVATAVTDWLPVVLAMVAYDLSRGAADGLGMPLQVRLPINIDQTLFTTSPTVWLQQRIGRFGPDVAWWEVPVSLVYASHFVVPFALGMWLWVRDRRRWQWWRDRFLSLVAAGLLTYVLLPTAPPWLAARRGELDPVQRTAVRGWRRLGVDVADRVFDLGQAAVNPVAALPSLHAAFALFVGVTLWRRAPTWLRPLLVLYPLAMGFVLVLTGEHYVFDVVVGWLYVVAVILVWRRVDGRLVPRRAAVAARQASPEQIDATPSAPPAVPPDRSLPRPVAVLAGVAGLLTMLTRAIGLGRPDVLVFDEAFYATQALEIAQRGVEQGHTVHPPAAKWAIAAGIRTFGFQPWGWRVVPLLAGAVVVAFTVVAAYRATRSGRLAALAALVVATDGIALTTGRLALLDGLVALWTTAALAVLVGVAARPLDAQAMRRALWPLGILFGLAIASKWSAAPVWLVSVAFIAWLCRTGHLPRRRALTILLLVPSAVYALSFVPTLAAYDRSAVARVACADAVTCDDGPFDRVRGVVHDHREILRFHGSLEPTNRYAVSSWNWIVQSRPAVLYDLGGRRIVARGNPAIWAAGAAALAWCGWWGRRRRRPVALLISLWALAWWAPWAVAQRPGYSFYAAPLVPVVAVGLVVALAEVAPQWRSRAMALVMVTCLIGAALMAPTLYGF